MKTEATSALSRLELAASDGVGRPEVSIGTGKPALRDILGRAERIVLRRVLVLAPAGPGRFGMEIEAGRILRAGSCDDAGRFSGAPCGGADEIADALKRISSGSCRLQTVVPPQMDEPSPATASVSLRALAALLDPDGESGVNEVAFEDLADWQLGDTEADAPYQFGNEALLVLMNDDNLTCRAYVTDHGTQAAAAVDAARLDALVSAWRHARVR